MITPEELVADMMSGSHVEVGSWYVVDALMRAGISRDNRDKLMLAIEDEIDHVGFTLRRLKLMASIVEGIGIGEKFTRDQKG
jgi:hypothetical protein